MTNDLLIWAVYRSLDNSTAPVTNPAGNLSSDEILLSWEMDSPSDEQILEALTRIYLHSISLQLPGEAYISLKGRFPLRNTKPQAHAPALWVDFIHPEPEMLSRKKPHLLGEQFIPIIRKMLYQRFRPIAPTFVNRAA